MVVTGLAAMLASLTAFGATVPAPPPPGASLVVFASQSGRPTRDNGKTGGNPFAAALIGLLRRPTLTHVEFVDDLIALTRDKSRGFMTPEARSLAEAEPWALKPPPPSGRRVALVFVYSDYREDGVPSLLGARRDVSWVAAALRAAGFEVDTAIDPTPARLAEKLADLSARSEGAEIAAIYSAGHGVEHDGRVYLAPVGYPFRQGTRRLPTRAIDVASLVHGLRADGANLVFFGGCRSYLGRGW